MITAIQRGYSKLEKVLLVLFTIIFLSSTTGLFYAFWVDNTDMLPADGGEYLEGAVGNVDENFKINPLFTFGAKANSSEADLTQLIFAGLMRYDPATGQHEDYLADHTLSEDKKTYTFVLKENLKWHDGHSITADDIIFTFRDVIQHPDFENEFLKTAFEGVKIEKKDERTVTFNIAEPYKFFLTNFTVGIVPRHILMHTPPKNLSLDSFNQEPIGAGPYKFSSISYNDPTFDEIRLTKFQDFILEKPKLEFITMRLYHKKTDLAANISQLDGVRPMLESESAFLPEKSNFKQVSFQLPQYIAVFINMDDPLFKGDKNQKMRWALQLATNKEGILQEIPGIRVDTPLLEIDNENWLSEYDPEKASGALKDSGWILPEKTTELEEEAPAEEQPEETEEPEETSEPEAVEESSEENTDTTEEETAESPEEEAEDTAKIISEGDTEAKYLYEPSKKNYFETNNQDFFMVGKFPEGTKRVDVNKYTLQLFNPDNNRFSYKINLEIGTIRIGENKYKIEFYDSENNLLDAEEITIKLTEGGEHSAPTEAPVSGEVSREEEPAEEPEAETTENPEELINIRIKETEKSEEEDEEQVEPEKLILKITTADSPEYLTKTAEIIQQQWEAVGIKVEIESLPPAELLQKIKDRDYQLLLYGQNLGYNLDAFPYWHLSQTKVGLNLSEYQNFEASVLLEEIRRTHNEEFRQKNLEKLQELMKEDVPAVFLYSPNYIMYIDSRFQNIEIEKLALFPDRFANIEDWYVHTKRAFVEDKSWFSFFNWFFGKIF